jgi:hypothetical protein
MDAEEELRNDVLEELRSRHITSVSKAEAYDIISNYPNAKAITSTRKQQLAAEIAETINICSS